MNKLRKIKIIKLDTDNPIEINNFIKLWKKLKPEVEEIFISKSVKFIGK